jgi:hypothetical protein
MNIRTEIRALEAHVKSLVTETAARIAIISFAQAQVVNDERSLAILSVMKRRILREGA